MAETQPDQEFDLRNYFQMLMRRKWVVLGFTAALTSLVGVGTALQPKIYETRASVVVGREPARLLDFDPLPQERFRERDYLKTQAAILTSRSFLQKATKRLIAEGFYGNVPTAAVERRSRELALALQYKVRVLTAEDTQVIQIAVQGGIAERIPRIANAIAEEYVNRSQEQKVAIAGEAVAWLQAQLEEARLKANEAEAELRAFKDKENIVDSGESDAFSALSLTRLNDEYLTTQFQRMERETRLAAIRKGARSRPSPGRSTTTASALNAEVQKALRESLKKEYVDAQLQLSDLSRRYGPEHPDIITLKAKVDKLSRELENLEQPETPAPDDSAIVPEIRITDLQAEYTVLLNKERALARALEAHKARARTLSRTEVRYAILKQNVDLARGTYTALLTRLNEAKLSGQIKNRTVQVLDRAEVPRTPVEPQPIRNLVVAVFLGLVLGVGLVLLMENLDRRLKSPEDAARYLNLQLLTVVPGIGLGRGVEREEGRAQLVTLQSPRSHAAECYRNLRTSILFSSGRPVPRTIVVTSAVAGEGKSTTAANLAVVMAQNGRKVLLIDADLRRPSLHRYFIRQGNRGLMKLLRDKCGPEEAVQPSGIENLDLLLCHGIPQNPSELLGSERMQEVIDQLKTRYDVVVIDSPVVISVPDAVILAARAEAVVLVHCPGATDRDMVRYAREKLDEVKANILGLVMNNVDLKAGRYVYTRYAYYGYGTEADEGIPQDKRKRRKP